MGIDIPAVQLLCCAKSIGVDFSDTATVGRQRIYALTDDIASILSALNIQQTSAVSEGQFSEPLFALLSARKVSSVDASDYEGATHVHDFNQPLPASLANRFSVVYDGGTIHYVFNIPQAFKNCMEMVRIGGHFIQISVANNYMGHGFWQLCPELIYRIFSRENGFQIKAVFMHEPNEMHPVGGTGASFGAWYKVEDPAAHHCRVELINDMPTQICTIAQRVEDRRIFASFPQQSESVEAWKEPRALSSIRRIIPRPIKKLVRRSRNALNKMSPDPFDRSYYRQISDDDLVQGRI